MFRFIAKLVAVFAIVMLLRYLLEILWFWHYGQKPPEFQSYSFWQGILLTWVVSLIQD